MSIRRKLTLMTTLISVIAVAIAITAVTLYLIYDMRKSKFESVKLIAAIAGDRNSAALAFGTKENIQNNLEIYRFSPSIRAVCVYNEAGDLFGEYVADVKSKQEFCLARFSTLPNKIQELITVRDEIRHNGMLLGWIYVVSDTSEIDNYVARITLISAIVICITLVLIFLATFYFSKTLSGPIMELTSTIKSITESKNYTLHAEVDYRDEIGVLASSFNKMLAEVIKRDKELAVANEELEEKILLRTRESLEARRKAEHANEAKSEFLRNMSHEFRTPLHAILSFSSYGLSECDTEQHYELKKYFDQIRKASERLGKLVNEVLDFAQMEHGTHNLLMKYTDLRELAGRAYEVVTSLLKDKNIMLCIEHYEHEVGVVCDNDKIIQVITNMLSNAIKFTPPGKTITLRTQVINNMSVLSVSDEGVGIPEEEKEVIFESFRQSSRTNAGTGGTGLGLAICRKIINAHQGRIWAENNNSTGACITFILHRMNSTDEKRAA